LSLSATSSHTARLRKWPPHFQLYQALDAAGIPVKLDLYGAMIHNFQDRILDAPEAILARRKMRTFLHRQLGM